MAFPRNVAGSARRFSPLALFAAGEQGGWWDPADFATMFQDTGATSPVTATGQSVALIRDKSGRGNHRTQATAASQPTLQRDSGGFYYLAYDGVDDSMATGTVDLTGTDKMTSFLGLRKESDAAQGGYAEHGIVGTDNLAISLLNAPRQTATGDYGATVRAAGLTGNSITLPSYASPNLAVCTTIIDKAGATIAAQVSMRVNGVNAGVATGVVVTSGNLGNHAIYFGRRAGATLPFIGREYQSIIRSGASTAAQITQAERFIARRMGIAL